MRPTFLKIARCPVCRKAGELAVEPERTSRSASGGGEVREGIVSCTACGARRGIHRGIVDLMPPEPPEFVRREAEGLRLFAAHMVRDRCGPERGWTPERLVNLPYEQTGYWYAQATAMHQTIGNVDLDFQPGDRVLDVGSNTCWASAYFAERDLEAIALDITPVEMQGLASADWWFEAKEVYFERVLGVMFDVPLADEVVDYVWCCEVLHHNHRSNLRKTMRELFRVLKPGGRLIVCNEEVRALLHAKLRPGHEVAEYGGHEHAYLRTTYVRAARAAGFDVELIGPWLHPTFTEATYEIQPQDPALTAVRLAARHAVRRSGLARRALLAWRNYVTGTALYMIGTKPA